MITKRVLSPLARTALMLSAAVAVATPATAADMKGEYGARTVGAYPAVPVPAPIPVPDTFNWYIRGDAGYALSSDGKVSASGGPQVTIMDSADRDGPYYGGIGFGRYITPSLRAEFGMELRNQQTIAKPGTYRFESQTQVLGVPNSIDTHTFEADRRDTTNLGSHTFMANLYYDLKTGTRFTPYVGAGAGLSLAVLKRRFSELADCVSTVNSVAGASLDPFGNPTCSGSHAGYNAVGGSKVENRWGPALALMAGTAVELAPGVSLDAGYRFIWQANQPSITMGSVNGDQSKVSVGNRSDHELRMGVRWDIW